MFMDREELIKAALRECRRIFDKLKKQEESYTGKFGRFPETAYIYYCGSSLQKPTDHFDASQRLRAWRLSGEGYEQLPDAQQDAQTKPWSGMYYLTGVFAFCISEDGRTAKINMWLGPRYGRGFVYDVNDEWGAAFLTNQRTQWAS